MEENPFEQSWRDDEATHTRGDDWFEVVNTQWREGLGQGVNQGGQAGARRGNKCKQPAGGHSEHTVSHRGNRSEEINRLQPRSGLQNARGVDDLSNWELITY
jgi:hypothetical protein